jgi:hypothetical protein
MIVMTTSNSTSVNARPGRDPVSGSAATIVIQCSISQEVHAKVNARGPPARFHSIAPEGGRVFLVFCLLAPMSPRLGSLVSLLEASDETSQGQILCFSGSFYGSLCAVGQGATRLSATSSTTLNTDCSGGEGRERRCVAGRGRRKRSSRKSSRLATIWTDTDRLDALEACATPGTYMNGEINTRARRRRDARATCASSRHGPSTIGWKINTRAGRPCHYF